MKKTTHIFDWTLRIVLSVILVQTLFFKFTGAEESKYIFSTLGVEPYGRIGIGIAELLTAILLLLPFSVWVGAGLALGLMLGALGAHIFVLGIEVQGDGGLLFWLAVGIAVGSSLLLYIRHSEWLGFLSSLFKH